MMKRLFYLILSVFVLTACSGNDSDNPEVPLNVVLEISTSELLFEGEGGTQEFTVTSSGSWEVFSSAEWCKTNVPAGSGNLTVAVTTEVYIGGEDERVAVVSVQAGNKKQELTVTQKPIEAIHFEQDTIYVAAEGETISVEVKNYVDGVEYQVTTSDWISPAPKGKAVVSKTHVFAVSANDEPKVREGYIIFSVGSLKDTVFIIQRPVAKDFTETISGVSLDMVYVQGGTFQMGATSEQGDDSYSNEQPVHTVTLSDYYIGRYEVTQGLWKAVMGDNPSNFQEGLACPVECVNWNEAQEFCTKLSKLTGRKYVLPTEAQWEYAARGGAKSQGYKYSGSNDLDEVAWYRENSGSKTHPVGQKKANELGIYDMSGNVYEWCRDWYGSYSSEAQTDPIGSETGSDRVGRGGGWNYDARYCRVSYREDNGPYNRYLTLGFRVALLP